MSRINSNDEVSCWHRRTAAVALACVAAVAVTPKQLAAIRASRSASSCPKGPGSPGDLTIRCSQTSSVKTSSSRLSSRIVRAPASRGRTPACGPPAREGRAKHRFAAPDPRPTPEAPRANPFRPFRLCALSARACCTCPAAGLGTDPADAAPDHYASTTVGPVDNRDRIATAASGLAEPREANAMGARFTTVA
jgi:hypothetical protein